MLFGYLDYLPFKTYSHFLDGGTYIVQENNMIMQILF